MTDMILCSFHLRSCRIFLKTSLQQRIPNDSQQRLAFVKSSLDWKRIPKCSTSFKIPCYFQGLLQSIWNHFWTKKIAQDAYAKLVSSREGFRQRGIRYSFGQTLKYQILALFLINNIKRFAPMSCVSKTSGKGVTRCKPAYFL